MIPSHRAPVSCAAASRDDRVLASGSYDRRILVWDAESGQVLRELVGHESLVNGLDWSPDGQYLASASSDYSVRIWHALTGRVVAILSGHHDDVNAVRFSPDGSRLASASFDGTVRVWTREGRCTLVAAHHGADVNAVAWLPAGDRLAATSDDCTVSIFEADGGRVRRILRGHSDWVDDVAVHPDGLWLASAGLDGTARVWNASSGEPLACLSASTCVVKAVAWSRDGRELAASSYDGALRVYEAGSLRLLRTLGAEALWNRTLQSTAHGWLTGSFGGGPVLIDERGSRQLGTATTCGLNGLALAPDGERLVVCSDDGGLYEVDLHAQQVTRRLGTHRAAVLCAAWSPDARLVATGSWDRTARVWDVASGRCVAEWAGLGDPINSVAFDASGLQLWLGTFNGDVVVWDLREQAIAVQGSHQGSVKSLAPAGTGVLSTGRDGSLRSWGCGAARVLQTPGSIVNGVAFDSKQGRIATASRRNGLELWAGDGQPLGAFRGHACSAKAVAWSGDGSRVAGVYYDGHLSLWDPHHDLVRVERISDASLSGVAFAGDELWVSSWDARGSVLRVDARSGAISELRTSP